MASLTAFERSLSISQRSPIPGFLAEAYLGVGDSDRKVGEQQRTRGQAASLALTFSVARRRQ